MTRRGFALLAVLWFVLVVGGLALATAAGARGGVTLADNRVTLTRGRWARNACLAILRARIDRDTVPARVGPIDLGGGQWCRAEVFRPASRLNVNLASEAALRTVIGNDTLADRVLDWRDADDVPRLLGAEREWYQRAQARAPRNGPFADVGELRDVAGMERFSEDQLRALFTIRGDGRLDPNLAPPAVLATLPGLDASALAILALARARQQPIEGFDALLAQLPAASQASVRGQFRSLTTQVIWRPEELIVSIVGGVTGHRPVDSAVVTLRVMGRRSAVLTREAE